MKSTFFARFGVIACLLAATGSNQAQTFSGTNAPGSGSGFTIPVPAAATNLSLVLSNTASSWAYLFLKRGAPATETDFDFVSRLDGRANQINLEPPQFVAGTTYGLRVSTPAASARTAFAVEVTTNRADLRAGGYPVLKPAAFVATGNLAKGAGGAWNYFQVDVPTNLTTGWRIVLSATGAGNPDLYIQRNQLPTQFSYDRNSENQTVDTVLFTPAEAAKGTYFIGVYLPASATGNASYTLTAELDGVRDIAWDSGSTCAGSTWQTNSSMSGGDYYLRIRPQTATNGAWRTFLQVVSGEADIYLAQGYLPTTTSFYSSSANAGPDEIVLLNDQVNTNQDWFLLVRATPGAQWRLLSGNIFVQWLSWDPGQTPYGTVLHTNDCPVGLNFFFKITTRNTTVGAWRTALNVQGGEADLYMQQGSTPSPAYHSFASAQTGSDGFVLHSSQFTAGQEWHLLVRASAGAQWNLMSGEAFVYNLGPLAADASSSTNILAGAEGISFFKTTIDTGTLAWGLWLNGASNEIRVRKASVPHPASYSYGEPVPQDGQSLVVPDYLASSTFDGYYFVSVQGTPGQSVRLDSRKHAVTDIAFASTNSAVLVTNFGYRTFRVRVPVQQIAWQINAVPVSGDPSFAVRRDTVPNEWNNDAYSEVPGSVVDSLTLVPPTLSDGTFYITVYGSAPYSFTLQSCNPVITDVPFLGTNTNADLNRVGWRFYRVPDINSQLGCLGWDLLLANAPPETGIALRRNAVPGQWNYRVQNTTYANVGGYVDYASSNGNLQRPGHQADIWYIGIYNPSEALNAFKLVRQLLVPQTAAFDGGTSSTTNQSSGTWRFFKVNVPSNALGWDVRLVNVTQGEPRLVVRRDLLPASLGTYDATLGSYWSWPCTYTAWASGNQWAGGADWTGLPYAADGTDAHVSMLAMGMGNPLEAGTYYVGAYADNGNCSYTLISRGIGLGMSIPVVDLPFTNGVVTNTVAAREAAYYRVIVGTNAPSWKVHLETPNGEALLLAQKDSLPNVQAQSWNTALGLSGGKHLQKSGDEHYVLLPQEIGLTNLAGTYYLAVVSEGFNPQLLNGWQQAIGTGSSTYHLRSEGALPVVNLGAVGPYGSPDLVHTNTLAGGECAAYQFTVPLNAASVEVRLEQRTGNPTLSLVEGPALPRLPDDEFWPWTAYGLDGGRTSARKWDHTLITVANPSNGVYSVVVQATHDLDTYGQYPDATYTLRVRAVPPTLIAFDGGRTAVANQPIGTWKFFEVNVPTNALGWDLRVLNVSTGAPQMVVRRDALPGSVATYDFSMGSWWSWPGTYTFWPTGHQWAAGADWTGYPYDADGNDAHANMLAMGMGNPLEAGTYYVGVYNNTTDTNGATSYTLLSRGIGPGMSIPVLDLAYTNGMVTNTLAARQPAYYRVTIETNAPSWKVWLQTLTGEAMLVAQKDSLPNIQSRSWNTALGLAAGKHLQKQGDEHYVLLPQETGLTNLAGTYYLAVVSEGMNPQLLNGWQQTIGTGSSTYRLHSQGALPVVDLGPLGAYGAPDLTRTNMLAGGESAAYQFTVPPNVASVEVRLERRTGNPTLSLLEGASLPRPPDDEYWPWNAYGMDGGFTSSRKWDHNLITVANPSNGVCSVVVQATHDSETYGLYPDTTYTLRVRAVPPTLVAFDGGTSAVSNQGIGTWKFFQVDVPADALGWDVRILNVSTGAPQLVVRRELLPGSLNTYDASLGSYWSWPCTYTGWPTGHQWAAGADWTGYPYDANGNDDHINMLAMGMGNPLEAGTYYVGIYNNTTDTNLATSYTLLSRGIGVGMSIPVLDLAFTNGVVTNTLPAREAAYYRVTIGTNAPSWKVQLGALSGEVMLLAQRDSLPNVQAGAWNTALGLTGGKQLQKTGDDQYVLLPQDVGFTNMAGTYYLAVVSEGMNPQLLSGWQQTIGTGGSTYRLHSQGALPVLDLGILGPVGSSDLFCTNVLAGGENAAYQFSVPPNVSSIEVRLEQRIGNPALALIGGPDLPRPADDSFYPWTAYGMDGGYTVDRKADYNIITVPNPTSEVYSVVVQALHDTITYLQYPEASYSLRVRMMPLTVLNVAPGMDTNGLSHSASGLLADNQRAFFQIEIPPTDGLGAPVVGWRLDTSVTQGSALIRVRKDLLPEDGYYNGTTLYSASTASIVPPYLSPGLWYVEVRGSGATAFTLTSSILTPKRLWVMPGPGQPNPTPGLTGLEFGDSGIDINAHPILDPQTGTVTDQGIDLEQGHFDYYAIVVPTNNPGLFRTTLASISGNLSLYLREGLPPTLSHGSDPVMPQGTVYDRLQTITTTAYGDWVALDSKLERTLSPGIWYLGVMASGNSNARYRLRVAQGNIQDLSLEGGSYTGQLLNGGDWRYYRIQIPSNAPARWDVTFGQQSGDVMLYVRDTLPPGLGTTANDFRDWASDFKNHGPYPSYDPPGTHTITSPPLRPGSTYYLGFRAINDAMFSVSSSTSGGLFPGINSLPFYGGFVTNRLPPNGTALYRIHAPADAARWKSHAIHDASVEIYLEQGTIPTLGWGNAHLGSPWWNDADWNLPLLTPNNWPWLPDQSYFLLVTNTSMASAPFSFRMDGRSRSTDDENNDGLPDYWQALHFGYYWNWQAAPDQDPDDDGLNNQLEFQLGTNPAVPNPGGVLVSISRLSGEPAHLLFLGASGQACQLESSTNLVDWTPVKTFTGAVGGVQLEDSGAATRSVRFYRVVVHY